MYNKPDSQIIPEYISLKTKSLLANKIYQTNLVRNTFGCYLRATIPKWLPKEKKNEQRVNNNFKADDSGF